ncbi:MAG: hypothetical protein U0798_00365 [Gemmataceae bacterium]
MKPAIKLSRETTYVTEFLDKDGYPDYETALNSKLRGSIKPEDNACVLLANAIGPTPGGDREIPEDYWKWLGISAPPKGEGYFKSYEEYAKSKGIPVEEEFDKRIDYQLMAQPWKPKEYPHVASWLKTVEAPLAIVTEASKRKEYYSPIVSRTKSGQKDSLFGCRSLLVSQIREIGSAYACRAMLKLAEDRPEEAWQDLITCHRLARLAARGNAFFEYVVGLVLEQMSIQAELIWLEHTKLNAKQLLSHLQQIDSLPPLPTIIGNIDLYERFNLLETICLVHKNGFMYFKNFEQGKVLYDNVDPDRQIAIQNQMNWDRIFQTCSKQVDLAISIFQEKNREKRAHLIDEYGEQRSVMKREFGNRDENISQAIEKGNNIPLIEKYCTNRLLYLVNPLNETSYYSYERAIQSNTNLRIAFALAAYCADYNVYPAKLDALKPNYLASIPDDLFSGKPLVYRITDKGYILYSVGRNEIDDGGKFFNDKVSEDEERKDDIGVRMPSRQEKSR